MKNLYLVIVLFIIVLIACLFQQQNEGFQCKEDPSNSDIFQKYQAGHRENNKDHSHTNHHTYAANDIAVCEKNYGEEFCKNRDNANYGSNKNDNYAMIQYPYFGKLEGDSALGYRYDKPVSDTDVTGYATMTDKGFYSSSGEQCNVGLSGISSCNVKGESVEDCKSKIPQHHKAYMGDIAGVGFRNNDYPIDKCKNTCIFYNRSDINEDSNATYPANYYDSKLKGISIPTSKFDEKSKIKYNPLFNEEIKTVPTTKANGPCNQGVGVCAEELYKVDDPAKYFTLPATGRKDLNDCLDQWYKGDSKLIYQENEFYTDKGNLPDIYAVGVDATNCKYYHSKDSSTRISGTVGTDKWLTHDLDSNYYPEKRCSLIVVSTINTAKLLYLNVKEGKIQEYIKGNIGDYGEMELSENKMIFNIKTEMIGTILKYYLLTEDNNFYVGIEQDGSSIKVVLRKMKISFNTEKIGNTRPAQIELVVDTDKCFEGLNKYILQNNSDGATAYKLYGVGSSIIDKAKLVEDKTNLQFIINEK